MARIAIDLDSTLYNFDGPAREAFMQLADKYDDKSLFAGAYHAWTEWRSPADICGLDKWLEVIDLCHDDEVILRQTPFNGAVETCQALLREGHDLIYISNRKIESYSATYDWLDECGFLLSGYGSLDVICTVGDKQRYMTECQYLIDDRPKTVIDFIYDHDWYDSCHQFHRRAFVKAYPYNQNLTDIPRCYLAPTWSGLNYYLVGKGVLSEPAINYEMKV